MRNISCLLLVCILTVLSVSGACAADSDTSSAEAAAVSAACAVNAFAFDAYRQLAEEDGNIFFSPYSISSALAMTYAGARGGTADEMAEAMRFTGDGIHAGMKSLRERFNSVPAAMGSLDTANSLWLDREERFTADYRLLTMENYAGEVRKADFLNAGESERLKINDWVARKTHDRIKDILQEDNVTPDTKLVLLNAVYFNSAWLEPFDKNLTKEEPFRTGKDTRHNVSMMHRTGRFNYGANDDAQWVKIPYRIPGFSMLILLPRENDSFTRLEALEQKLTPEAFASLTAETRPAQVALSMPKFKDEQRYSLGDMLNKLGMNLAFTEDADFSGLVEEPRKNGYALHIDFVVHKAFIELDEEKTEAAAATAVGMARTLGAIIEKPIEFNADHPFIYFLTDDETGTILFMGRMAGQD